MNRRQFLASSAALLAVRPSFAQEGLFRTKYFPISAGIGLHDLAPARDGTVWFTAQGKGMLGRLDPTGMAAIKTVSLGQGAAPHGVTIGPDGAPWITEGGQNAIARVDPAISRSRCSACPKSSPPPISTPACSTRKAPTGSPASPGYYGRLKPRIGEMDVFRAPRVSAPTASR